MADIDIRLRGDSSGAVDAFKETAGAAGETAEATQRLGDSTNKAAESQKKAAEESKKLEAAWLALGAVAVKMGVDAANAFAEAERVSRQLQRVAGDLADDFEAQADALSMLLKVDDDVIKQQQTLLLQWGQAPAEIEGTVRAIQSYAAFMGKDAVDATREMIRAVESGTGHVKGIGVEFQVTGDKVKDLTNLTKVLAGEFGNAAEVNSNSLGGRISGVRVALGNLQEAFGGVISDFDSKLGVLEKVASFFGSIARGIEAARAQGGVGGFLGAVNAASPGGLVSAGLDALLGAAPGTTPALPSISNDGRMGSMTGGSLSFDLSGKAEASRAAHMQEVFDKNADVYRKYLKDVEAMDDEAAARETQALADSLQREAGHVEASLNLERQRAKDREAIRIDEEKKQAEWAEKQEKNEKAAEEKSAQELEKRMKERQKEWQAAGDAIGAAFVNGLADQLSKLAEGGEFDPALFVGEILAATVGTAIGIIGTAYGMPAVGAAFGNLASMGIRAGFGAMSKSARGRGSGVKYHSGGWVGAPRHHAGEWIGDDEHQAILQTGERVLSNAEVARMGGRSGVDKAARGGGRGLNVTINAIDAKSAAEGFTQQLGRAMKNALTTGRGDLPGVLGMVPR